MGGLYHASNGGSWSCRWLPPMGGACGDGYTMDVRCVAVIASK